MLTYDDAHWDLVIQCERDLVQALTRAHRMGAPGPSSFVQRNEAGQWVIRFPRMTQYANELALFYERNPEADRQAVVAWGKRNGLNLSYGWGTATNRDGNWEKWGQAQKDVMAKYYAWREGSGGVLASGLTTHK